MYKFTIEDKEFIIGKLSVGNSMLLALEDQSKIMQLDGISILGYEIDEGTKTLVKNNVLGIWSFKESLGTISFSISITATTDAEKLAKLNIIKNMLGNESIIQISDTAGTKYIKSLLLFGGIDDTLDTSKFNVVYGFKKDDCGVGVYPLPPSYITTSLKDKELTIKFKKGGNAALTKIVCNGTEYSTADETLTISLPSYDTKYSIEFYSISSSNIVGDVTTRVVTTGKQLTIPTMPTNVAIKTVIGKYVTITFTKGTNAYKTEIILGDIQTETYGEEVTILAKDYNTTYDLKLKSVSSDGGVSDETDVIKVTTLEPIIPLPPTINEVTVQEDVITFKFSIGKDAMSTEFLVDGKLYTTQENNLVVKIGAYNKTVTYKARSISYTEDYSDYTVEGSTTTQIVPQLPAGISVIINGKAATFTFTKGVDSVSTEFVVDGTTYTTDTTTLVVDIGAYSKPFTYKARSKSSTGNYSDYTTEASATTDIEHIIPTVPTNIKVSTNGTVATFSFTQGTNAIVTEFVVDGTTHSTDGTTLVVDIGAYSKSFAYKARSKSSSNDYSDYTTEASTTTDVQAIVPTVPTNIKVSTNGKVVTFSFTKGTNAVSTEFVVDGVSHSTDGTTLVVDIGAYSKSFTYKARSTSSTNTYSAYTDVCTATTGELITSKIIFNLYGKIVGSIEESPIKLSLNDEEITQDQYEYAKGSTGVDNCEVCVDFTSFVSTYYEGDVSKFRTDLVSISLGGGYLFNYKTYDYSSTKTETITSDFANIISNGKQLRYKVDKAANFSVQIEVKSSINVPIQNPIIPTVPTNISVSTNGKVVTFSFTKGTNAISTEFVVDGVSHSTDTNSLVVDIGAYAKTFTYKARSISSTKDYSDYTTEANATTNAQTLENVLLDLPADKSNANQLNINNNYSPKDYVMGAVIEIDGLTALNANRYSVGASVVNGILIKR